MAVKHSFGVKGAVGEVNDRAGGGRKPPPPAGVYRALVKQLTLVENSNGDPMFTAILELKMPAKLKKHNGFWVWHRLNITDQGAPYVNGFLNALAGDEERGLKLQRDLWENDGLVTKDDMSKKPTDVLKIGTFVIGSPDGKKQVTVSVEEDTYLNKEGNEVETVVVTQWMPADASLKGDDGDDDDEADDDLDESDDLGDDPESDLGDDDEEAEMEAQLKELDLKALRIKARDEYDIAPAETKGKTVEEVIDMILDAHFGDADEEPEEGAEEKDELEEDDLDEKPEPPKRRTRKGKNDPPF